MTRNHKERKWENSKLKEQAMVDNDKMEKLRAECEELRCRLQDARIDKNEGTQAEVAKKQQTETAQHREDAAKNKEGQMEVEATVPTKTATEDAGSAISETTGDTPAVEETPHNAEAGEVHCASDTVKNTSSDENAEESQTKEVTFEENNNGKTQTGSAHEQPPLGTGEKGRPSGAHLSCLLAGEDGDALNYYWG